MKFKNFLNFIKLIVSILLIDSISSQTFDKNWIEGYWIGEGYTCNNKIQEDVTIEYVNGEFVATKERGSDCVPAGHVTLRGKIPENFVIGQNYPCVITMGTIDRPSYFQNPDCRIVPLEKDKFVVNNFGITFSRIKLYPENYDPLSNKVCRMPGMECKNNKYDNNNLIIFY